MCRGFECCLVVGRGANSDCIEGGGWGNRDDDESPERCPPSSHFPHPSHTHNTLITGQQQQHHQDHDASSRLNGAETSGGNQHGHRSLLPSPTPASPPFFPRPCWRHWHSSHHRHALRHDHRASPSEAGLLPTTAQNLHGPRKRPWSLTSRPEQTPRTPSKTRPIPLPPPPPPRHTSQPQRFQSLVVRRERTTTRTTLPPVRAPTKANPTATPHPRTPPQDRPLHQHQQQQQHQPSSSSRHIIIQR